MPPPVPASVQQVSRVAFTAPKPAFTNYLANSEAAGTNRADRLSAASGGSEPPPAASVWCDTRQQSWPSAFLGWGRFWGQIGDMQRATWKVGDMRNPWTAVSGGGGGVGGGRRPWILTHCGKPVTRWERANNGGSRKLTAPLNCLWAFAQHLAGQI